MTKQPSNKDLQEALERTVKFKGVIEFEQLKALREKRTTWFGRAEHDLMFAIDRFLRGEG